MKGKNPVNWFEIYVSDLDTAKQFYSNVLGTSFMDVPAPDGGEMAMFESVEDGPNASGSLFKHPDCQPGPGGTAVYFECEDVANEAGRVEENGGKLIVDKKSIGEHGFIAMFEDPDGNHIGLHSRN